MLPICKSTLMHFCTHETNARTHTHTPTNLWYPGRNTDITVVLACLDYQESLFLPQSSLFPSWVWASESLLLGERLSEPEVLTWVDVIDLDRLFVHLPPGYALRTLIASDHYSTDETINLKLYKNIWTLGKPEFKKHTFIHISTTCPKSRRKSCQLDLLMT